jgi:carboxynorspermidine decarboxylase
MWSVFPVIREYLVGTTASSVSEARLGKEEFGGEGHVFAPAYTQRDIDELGMLVDHIVFNSPAQLRKYREQIGFFGVHSGLRINPEHREVETELYDPCAPGSRLGTRYKDLVDAHLSEEEWADLDGLHFHNLCQKNSDALERTLAAVEQRFGEFLPRVSWVNFGGGHHISRPDYDVDRLVRVVRDFSERWGKQVYLEPGEAAALSTGFLVSEVLDILPAPDGGVRNVIMDASATAHMPDVLEMPYRPEILGGYDPGDKPHTYRLGGLTCLAGDVIGDWSFEEPLEVGDRLVFTDMAHYTMVKTTTFNGVRHPGIATYDPDNGDLRLVREFGYEDYKRRLS